MSFVLINSRPTLSPLALLSTAAVLTIRHHYIIYASVFLCKFIPKKEEIPSADTHLHETASLFYLPHIHTICGKS